MKAFLSKDPPGETKEDIRQKEDEGDADYGQHVQAEQQHRLQSIVKVLQHYENEKTTPFKVLGVTVTRDIFTLVRNRAPFVYIYVYVDVCS